MSRKEQVKKVAYICLIVILALVMLYSGLRILESTVLRSGQEQDPLAESNTIVKDGVTYLPRQDITVMLLMGIDDTGPVQESGSYNNSGQADMVALVVFDKTNETVNVLNLNRDTMLDMPVLGIGGKQAGTKYGQLALSHTYGTGLKDSCRNTRTTVSDFFNGLEINYYIAMNMDTIAILNDAVGGVTVNVREDFSKVDPTITMGELTLTGEQAMIYVRTRQDVGDQKNLSRMERQSEYMNAFFKKFKEKSKDEEFVLKVLEDISPYIVTDLTTKSMSAMVSRYESYSMQENISLPGENVLNGEHYEFYPDEAALEDVMLRLFYAPQK